MTASGQPLNDWADLVSNSQLEDRQAREQAAEVVAALGISHAELDRTEWEIVPVDSNEGVAYANTITFEPGSDPSVLSKIAGLIDGRWVRIGLLPDRDGSDDQ